MNSPKKLLTSLANSVEVAQGAPALKGLPDVITTFTPFTLEVKPKTAPVVNPGSKSIPPIGNQSPANKAK